MSETVLVEQNDGIATVTLNRPGKHNGLDLDMIDRLITSGQQLKKDRSLRAVILHGAGKSFCAGLDFGKVGKDPAGILKSFLKLPLKSRNRFQDCAGIWRELPVPVIAAIHGHCYGGGLQVALAADFRIARPDARFSVMEIKWGMVPDMTGTRTLAELVRIDVAKELAMTGRVIGGEEAAQLGLLTRLAEDPMAAALTLASELCGKSPDALAATKALFRQNWTLDENGAYRNERTTQARVLMGKNQRIAMKSNFAKQAPCFKQRHYGSW